MTLTKNANNENSIVSVARMFHCVVADSAYCCCRHSFFAEKRNSVGTFLTEGSKSIKPLVKREKIVDFTKTIPLHKHLTILWRSSKPQLILGVKEMFASHITQ